MKLFIAPQAFINYEGRILVLRESSKYKDGTNIGLYDVPGGRLKPEETFEQGFKREVKEESGLDIEIDNPFYVWEWWPEVREEKWHIIGVAFECFSKTNQVTLSPDHDDYQWIDPKNLENANIISDLKPAFQRYLEFKHKNSVTISK